MCDSRKTKKTLLEELKTLRSRAAELERIEAEHKKVEQKLKQYQFMVESAHDVIFFKDLNSRYVIANDKTLEAFGLSREQVIGKNDYEIMPKKAEAGKNIEDDKLVFETGKPTEIIKHMTGSDGKERWFQAIKVPQFDSKGNIIGLIGIARDITERKKVEEEIKRAAEEWDRTFDAIADLVFIVDKDFTITKMNKALPEALKLKPEDIIGKKCYELLHKSDKPWPGCPFEKTKKDKEPRTQEVDDPNIGIPLLISTSPIFDGNGKLVGAVHIAKDITEHKKAEETLRKSGEKYQLLFEGTGTDNTVISVDGVYLMMNEKGAEHLGGRPEHFIGKSVYDTFPKDAADEYVKRFRHIAESGEIQTYEDLVELPVGSCWFLTNMWPVKDPDGNITSVQLISQDITEHKKAEEELLFKSTLLEAQSETSIDGILVVDSEGKSLSFNNNFGRMWNIPQQILDTRDDEKMLQYVLDQLKNPEQFLERVKYLYAHKNEKSRDEIQFRDGRVFDRYSSPLLDSNDKYCGRVWYFRDITEHKRAEEALQKARDELEIRVEQRTADLARANVQLRSLASELPLAEERMRRRIAMDVHDHVGQNLAISKIKIESLRESAASPELAEDLEEIRNLISQTIESTRSLTFELSPPVLYELGFEAAVEWLVRQTRQQYGLSADFKADGQTKPLDNNVRILLFQAVRELLVNVAKHAQAHNVTVSTRRVRNEIRVSVEDDGVGFDISKAGSHDYKTGGFGLFSIRERLGHIGGHLEIQSKPGRGTRVTLTAPIDQESQNSGEGRK